MIGDNTSWIRKVVEKKRKGVGGLGRWLKRGGKGLVRLTTKRGRGPLEGL